MVGGCVHLPERWMCELSQLMTRSLHRLVQMSRATRLTLASVMSSPSRIEQTVSTFDTQCSSIAASTFTCVTSHTPATISCTCTREIDVCELSQLMTPSLHHFMKMSRATQLTPTSVVSSTSRIEQTVSTLNTQCYSILRDLAPAPIPVPYN